MGGEILATAGPMFTAFRLLRAATGYTRIRGCKSRASKALGVRESFFFFFVFSVSRTHDFRDANLRGRTR